MLVTKIEIKYQLTNQDLRKYLVLIKLTKLYFN